MEAEKSHFAGRGSCDLSCNDNSLQIFLFSVMLITGIFGNLAVCCVILRIPTMKTATNYYLFSLAVADLLILLVGKFFYWYLDLKKSSLTRFFYCFTGVPNELHVFWQYYPWILGEPMCKMRNLISEM